MMNKSYQEIAKEVIASSPLRNLSYIDRVSINIVAGILDDNIIQRLDTMELGVLLHKGMGNDFTWLPMNSTDSFENFLYSTDSFLDLFKGPCPTSYGTAAAYADTFYHYSTFDWSKVKRF
jgi:hypothetical protein